MERNKKVSGSITTDQFLYNEIKITAPLFLEGKTLDEAAQIISKDNLYQFPTERNNRRITRTCYKRLEALGSKEAIEELLNGPSDQSRLMNLYAIARTNGLVWEFLKQVLGEKFINQDRTFSRPDINSFISNLQATDEAAAKWKGSTPAHIAQILLRFMVEAGYLDSKTDTTINSVYLDDPLKHLIEENNEEEILPAFHSAR